MLLRAFTIFHVIISLLGIAAGFVVMVGMVNSNPMNSWTLFFLVTTMATSVTGFMFPVKKLMPSHVVGFLSVIVLGLAIYGKYAAHFAGSWRWIYVVTALLGQYFNVFVLVVQSFQKIPALRAKAPTQKEPPFQIAQLAVLVIFVVVGFLAVRQFHP